MINIIGLYYVESNRIWSVLNRPPLVCCDAAVQPKIKLQFNSVAVYFCFVQISASTVVCSAHFKRDDYSTPSWVKKQVLRWTAVPSVFNWSRTGRTRKPPAVRQSTCSAAVGSVPSDPPADPCVLQEVIMETETSAQLSSESQFDHDYTAAPRTVDAKLEAAQKRIEQLEAELQSMNVSRFGLERFSGNKTMIKYYTGFPTYLCLITFFNSIVQHAASMLTYTQVKRGVSTTQHSFGAKLLLIDQLFMFLHKLRVGSLDQDLADKFRVSQSTVSRNTVTWANFLYEVLGSQSIWPTRPQVQKYMPASFKALYPNTRVVIDCTEIAVQSPSSMMLRSEFFPRIKVAQLLNA